MRTGNHIQRGSISSIVAAAKRGLVVLEGGSGWRTALSQKTPIAGAAFKAVLAGDDRDDVCREHAGKYRYISEAVFIASAVRLGLPVVSAGKKGRPAGPHVLRGAAVTHSGQVVAIARKARSATAGMGAVRRQEWAENALSRSKGRVDFLLAIGSTPICGVELKSAYVTPAGVTVAKLDEDVARLRRLPTSTAAMALVGDTVTEYDREAVRGHAEGHRTPARSKIEDRSEWSDREKTQELLPIFGWDEVDKLLKRFKAGKL